MKFAVKVTRIERTKGVSVESIIRTYSRYVADFLYHKCDGCGKNLMDNLPWSMVWGVRLSDGMGGGYKLCCHCTEEAKKEMAKGEQES